MLLNTNIELVRVLIICPIDVKLITNYYKPTHKNNQIFIAYMHSYGANQRRYYITVWCAAPYS